MTEKRTCVRIAHTLEWLVFTTVLLKGWIMISDEGIAELLTVRRFIQSRPLDSVIDYIDDRIRKREEMLPTEEEFNRV